jgi:hypothetical protein
LGLSETEIGECNFELFEELLDRHLEEHRRRMLYAGVVAAEIWNANPYRGENAKYISPLDFVPDSTRLAAKAKPQTLAEQIAVLTQIFGCGPGKPN